MDHQLNPSKIIGECSNCHHLYDICRQGLYCDRCGATTLRGARWTDAESPVVDLDPDTTREIVWLEKLYDLDSEGSRP